MSFRLAIGRLLIELHLQGLVIHIQVSRRVPHKVPNRLHRLLLLQLIVYLFHLWQGLVMQLLDWLLHLLLLLLLLLDGERGLLVLEVEVALHVRPGWVLLQVLG